MAISKVIFNGETLMDVTGDNPATDNMLTGTKATGADGRSVNGAVVTAPASDTNPAMDGTANAGSSNTYSRGDHVHPSDTTKLDKSGGTMTGALTLSGAPTANLHAATKKYVDDAIGEVNSFEYEVVQALPTTNIKDHTIYLVSKTGTTGDVYDEYLRINNAWEHIGSTDIDLSGYVPTSRTVNGKALSSNISLTASDVGALPDSTTIPAQTAKIWTGSCSTAEGTSAKVVTLDDATGFSLIDGVKIAVTFTYGQTNGNGTLNVNNTGAKDIAIMYNVTGTGSGARDDICWGQHETVFFTYSGTQWLFEGSGYLHSKTYNLASSALPKSGGTMTGALTLSGAPTANLHAATKKYVDDSVADKVPTTRTVNSKALSSDITLTASDVGALPDSTTIPAQISKIWTGTCTVSAGTTAKTATLDDSTGFSLTAGVRVAVTFQYGNSATTPTLNVNSTGAKTIAIPSSTTAYTTGNGTTLNTWGAYETVIFTYSGTYWVHEPSGYQTYLLAPKASPSLTGTPTAPTAAAGTNTTQIATTAFVQNAVSSTATTVTTSTLLASGWSNGSYSGLQTTYPAASYNLEIEVDGDTVTLVQFEAWNNAKIVGSNTTNVIKALGDVPTVDIPIVIRVTAK